MQEYEENRGSRDARGQDLTSAQVGPQCGRYKDGTVGLLVVLEQCDDRARRGAQRAVEGRDRPGTFSVAGPDVEPSRLEFGAVRRRRQLTVTPVRRDPCLTVELAGGRRAEIACRGIDDAVGQLKLAQELLLPSEQAHVFIARVLGLAEDEHLDLVEPVHAEDAPRIAAM